MARNISISFSLTAALTGGFKGAFQSAASSARNVASAIREMEKSPVGHLGAAMAQQREKIRGLAGSLKEAKTTLATLQSQAQASGNTTRLLATQIRMAEDRVNNLNGALSRQRNLLLNTAAQAATSGRSLHQLGQEYNSLTQNIERAKKAQTALHANRAQADALRSQRQDLNSRLTGAVAAATTVAAPVALSIGFEDQMAKVGAVSRAEKDDLAALTAQARQLGRDTSFSASQAAEGMQYLAMAGFKTSQVMAAMPGMLDLAAASGTDLGQTANIASNILSAFELKAEQMGHVGDVLVAAFTSSNTTLESLGETMKYVGPVAKDAGASIEDAVAMAAMLGNVGISGSQAGTTSKSIFARLAAPPTEAAKALNALNIQTKDAQGNLRAVPDILEEITLKTASMGTADRTDVFSHIFGLEPMAGASALAKQAAQTVDENGRQIVDSMGKPTTALLKFADDLKNASKDIDGKGGAAKRVASQMNATTGGELRRLKSAWEDTGISVGNLFLPAIRMAAGGLSTIANVISATVNRFPLLSKGIALVVGGVIALTVASVAMGLVMNFVRTGLNGFRGGLLRISAASVAATASTTASTAAAGGFGIASRIAGAGARFFAGGLRSILMATGVGALLVGLGFTINLLIDNWDAVVAAMSAAWAWVTDTWGRLGVFFSELGQNLLAIFPGIWDGVCNLAGNAKDRVIAVLEGITGFFSGIADSISAAFAWAANGIGASFAWAKAGVLEIWNGVTDFFGSTGQGISDCFSGVWQGIVDLAAWAWEGIASVWTGASDFFGGIVDSIFGVFTGLFDWLQEKFAWVFSAIDAVGSVIGSITGAVKGAWNAAFGDNGKKDGKSAAPAANGEKAGFQGHQAASQPEKQLAPKNVLNASGGTGGNAAPKYQPVSANAYHAAFDGKNGKAKKSSGGSRSRSGASGGGGRSHSGATSGTGSGPVTVVTLDSGNEIRTQFIPATSGVAKPLGGALPYGAGTALAGAARAAASTPITGRNGSALQTAGQPALPQAPAMIARKQGQKAKKQQPGQQRSRWERSDPTDAASSLRGQGISIDLTQNFDLITQDASAVRKVLEAIRPDMEALIRRALEKISSDRRRTSYAQ